MLETHTFNHIEWCPSKGEYMSFDCICPCPCETGLDQECTIDHYAGLDRLEQGDFEEVDNEDYYLINDEEADRR